MSPIMFTILEVCSYNVGLNGNQRLNAKDGVGELTRFGRILQDLENLAELGFVIILLQELGQHGEGHVDNCVIQEIMAEKMSDFLYHQNGNYGSLVRKDVLRCSDLSVSARHVSIDTGRYCQRVELSQQGRLWCRLVNLHIQAGQTKTTLSHRRELLRRASHELGRGPAGAVLILAGDFNLRSDAVQTHVSDGKAASHGPDHVLCFSSHACQQVTCNVGKSHDGGSDAHEVVAMRVGHPAMIGSVSRPCVWYRYCRLRATFEDGPLILPRGSVVRITSEDLRKSYSSGSTGWVECTMACGSPGYVPLGWLQLIDYEGFSR